MKVFLVLLFLALAGAAYYQFFYRPAHPVLEARYVVPATLPLMDSRAEVRAQIGELHAGERVEVYSGARSWARVRTAGGQVGWVESKNLLDADTFAAGGRLVQEVEGVPVQASGNLTTDSSLRLNPSRDAVIVSNVTAGEPVAIVGRRIVTRPGGLSEKSTDTAGEADTSREPARDVWYLVRRRGQAGWLIGRYVSLNIPQEIGAYAQDVNLVAWLVLDRVQDNGTPIPQYVVADRRETEDADFSRIRVLTWWTKRHHYVTAYVESNLSGYFPIVLKTSNGASVFRLRLVDKTGRKFQKVYGLFGSVVRVLGAVDGWESAAIPLGPEERPGGRREKRRASRSARPGKIPLRGIRAHAVLSGKPLLSSRG